MSTYYIERCLLYVSILLLLTPPPPPLRAPLAASSTTVTSEKMKHSKLAKIYDVKTNVTLYDNKILQMLVSWKDTLANDTSYNIIATALNTTECTDAPCCVYGVAKPKTNLVIPESPMTYIEVRDCNFMFGCNYTITVETSNAMISQTGTLTIPDCVMNVCSCRHAGKLPKILLAAHVPNNNTINLKWSIELSNSTIFAKGDILTSKMFFTISEQKNPTLPWGGNVIPIAEKIYTIKNMTYSISTRLGDTLVIEGILKIRSQRQLISKAVLNLHTYLIDEQQCVGPTNVIKIQVPAYYTAGVSAESDLKLRIGLIVMTTLFISAIIITVIFCVWRRRKEHILAEELKKKNEICLSQYPAIVEMEDNINYVDKYIEEAQVKGLADMFEIPHNSLQMGNEIGEGAFGRVYKAIAINLRRMRGTTVVAVKQLKKNPSADEVSEFLSEIEMLKGVGRHNNIVCFLGCCTIRPPYLMIMEYVGRGDLLSYLRTVRYEAAKGKISNYVICNNNNNNNSNNNDNNNVLAANTSGNTVKYIELKISTQSIESAESNDDIGLEQQRQQKPSFAETTYTIIEEDGEDELFEYILDNKELHNFALQIANGMRFLEEQEITHRDLAARNVLIDDHKTLKISDFGLSRHGIYTNTKTRKLPLRWLSIEAIRDNIYSNKSDVWAYGVVLWEIGTLGASPYPTISNHELIPYLVEGKRLEKPEICTAQVYTLMLQCWHEDPNERPTFEEVHKVLSPKTAYVDISKLSDDYVFPPIHDRENNIY